MNCKELAEIADTYLCGELLVETNHAILGHLESCRSCRELIGGRRELRQRIRHAVLSAEASRLDPSASVKIKARLRAEASPFRASFFSPRLIFATVSALVLISVIGTAVFQSPSETAKVDVPQPSKPITLGPSQGQGPQAIPVALLENTEPAVEDHKHCALSRDLKEKPISLDEASKEVDPVNIGFDTAVMEGVRADNVPSCELMRAHYCEFRGVHFTHIILERGGNVVSVLMTRVNDAGPDPVAPMECNGFQGFQAACFKSRGYAVYVVSEMSVADNLDLANDIYKPVDLHLLQFRKHV